MRTFGANRNHHKGYHGPDFFLREYFVHVKVSVAMDGNLLQCTSTKDFSGGNIILPVDVLGGRTVIVTCNVAVENHHEIALYLTQIFKSYLISVIKT